MKRTPLQVGDRVRLRGYIRARQREYSGLAHMTGGDVWTVTSTDPLRVRHQSGSEYDCHPCNIKSRIVKRKKGPRIKKGGGRMWMNEFPSGSVYAYYSREEAERNYDKPSSYPGTRIAALEAENAKLREALDKCELAIEHAIELGHVGDGSTLGLFQDARAALKEIGEGK